MEEVNFRRLLFEQVYPDENISNLRSNFFELNYNELSVFEIYHYERYWCKLNDIDRIKQEQNKFQLQANKFQLEAQKNVARSKLSPLYGTEILEKLMKSLPENCFYDNVQNIQKTSFLTICAAFSVPTVKLN